MNNTFTPETLVSAIKALFELNNYEVKGPIQIHGAEIDLVAKSITEQFASPIYIEATIEYVSNEKYGKDLTKFSLIREKDPSAKCIIISSNGFTTPVRERANETRIDTYTYEELFQKFQNFTTYIKHITETGQYADELGKLNKIYEEAYFNDNHGKDIAINFLNEWTIEEAPLHNWIIVVGDYGTGKTALTKVLERRLAEKYKNNPNSPIPFRVELREFSKQFDERGLIHHFLDSKNLKIPIDFIFDLINKGKIILILDGYDEMAQYMHIRERRSCLSTLAKLSSGGARGILTSRPNYFTVSEELDILDTFYNKIAIEKTSHLKTKSIDKILEEERSYDNLLKRFVDRYERLLQDLDEVQTKQLIGRMLEDDTEGQEIILRILDRVFRNTTTHDEISLSGKPVIISYLLEVIDEIKRDDSEMPIGTLSEWDIFDFIILKLMLRDFRRAEIIPPNERRKFLQLLSIEISSDSNFKINEDRFKKLVTDFFQYKFKTIQLLDEREKIKEQYFADLRSSSTLTRILSENYWQFSHNSLREFLATDYYLTKIIDSDFKINKHIHISDVMKNFILSQRRDEIFKYISNLKSYYEDHVDIEVIGLYVSLLWNGSIKYYQDSDNPIGDFLNYISNGRLNFSNLMLSRLEFSVNGKTTNLSKIIFNSSILSDITFNNCVFLNSDFSESILIGIRFENCQLVDSDFSKTVIEDVDFTTTNVTNTKFTDAEIKLVRFNNKLYSGKDALGVLSLNGAIVKGLESIYIYKHHERYPIAEKISTMLLGQSFRQIRGLTQRGAAAKNPSVAKEFLDKLIAVGYASIKQGRKDLVGITDLGRKNLQKITEQTSIPESLLDFFDQ